jgi:hypothetical protein
VCFADFEQSIVSADLKAVAKHWNDVRGDKRMPAWGDIRPAAIAKQLPIIWSYTYDAQQDEFVGRLAGEAIARIFGRAIRGVKLSELTSIIGRDKLVARLKRVMQEPALVSGYGALFSQHEHYGVGERIIMPLATDGQKGDAILGATEYRTRGYMASEASELREREQWFSLSER